MRKKMIVMRMNDEEYKSLQSLHKKSTDRHLSNYLRKVSLQQPVTIKYRNQTADDFLKDMVGLKKELNYVGNNFNQAVHKLHLLHDIPDFRKWIQDNNRLYQLFMDKVEAIQLRTSQLYEQWLLK